MPVPVLWEHDSHPVGKLDGLCSMIGLSRFVPGAPLSLGGQRRLLTILVTSSKMMMFPQIGGPEALLMSALVNSLLHVIETIVGPLAAVLVELTKSLGPVK